MKESYFLSQPHQPFFVLGIVNAVVMMLLFTLAYKGVISLAVEIQLFHPYSLVYFVFSNVFIGFLFTTFPRFNQTQVIAKNYYTLLFYNSTIATVVFVTSLFLTPTVVALSMVLSTINMLFFSVKLQQIYNVAQVPEKRDSFWILSGVYFGVFASLLYIIALFYPVFLPTATGIAVFLYILFVAFSVAQRMIPFFSHSFATKDPKFVPVIFVLFLLYSLFFALSLNLAQAVIALLISLYSANEIRRWQLHPLQSPAILWVLHLALFWIPVGFFLTSLSHIAGYFLHTSFYFLDIHLLVLGFLTTVLIGFGTRVTLGHSGQAPHADRFSTTLFYLTQVVVLMRALVSFDVAFGWGLFFLFDIAAMLWIVLFVLWGVKHLKTLLFGNR